MPIEPHELAAIKTAASVALVDEASLYHVPVVVVTEIGRRVLAAIDDAATDTTDPRPFPPGAQVRVIATNARGTVARAVETDGELHTVWVGMTIADVVGVQVPFGPRELEVIG